MHQRRRMRGFDMLSIATRVSVFSATLVASIVLVVLVVLADRSGHVCVNRGHERGVITDTGGEVAAREPAIQTRQSGDHWALVELQNDCPDIRAGISGYVEFMIIDGPHAGSIVLERYGEYGGDWSSETSSVDHARPWSVALINLPEVLPTRGPRHWPNRCADFAKEPIKLDDHWLVLEPSRPIGWIRQRTSYATGVEAQQAFAARWRGLAPQR